MENLTTKSIREIATENPVTTRVFEELKIDYCCGGEKLFSEACRNAGVSPVAVAEKIEEVIASAGPDMDSEPTETGLAALVDHIIEKHHIYTRDEIGRLTPLMAKVVERHGERHGYLRELQKLTQAVFGELIPHMQKEEMILFPYISRLEPETGEDLPGPPAFGTVQNPIRMMMMEHENAGEILREMRSLTDDYTLPEGACPSFTALFARLEAFEKDLHRHIHLENNILFPGAIRAEVDAASSAAR